MKKKILIPIIIVAGALGLFALVACGNDNETTSETAEESVDIVAEIPYINRFTCDYYTTDGEKIEKDTVFEPSDEIRLKTNFILLPDAYAEGKGKFTVKFILSADFTGKIASANSSATSDKDLTATFTADDKNPKNCEIETRINVNYSAGSFKIAYAYDDEEYTEVCELPLNNDKTLLYTYDKATDGYIVSRNSDNSEWFNSMEEVYLPDSYYGKPITIMDKELFKDCINLTNVEIPNNVMRIESGAFFGCKGLISVTIPDSVKSIGEFAFNGCSSLESITLPFIGASKSAYEGYDNVFGYIFGWSVSREYLSVEDEEAEGLTWQYVDGHGRNYYYYIPASLKTVILSGDRIEIWEYSFENCRNLKKITLQGSVECIQDLAFYGCNSLTSIILQGKVTSSIQPDAFYGCDNLQYNEYGNAKYLGNEQNPYIALIKSLNTDITSVEINEATKVICDCAFIGCSNLTSIAIPNSVISIGDRAFNSCSSLTSITLPDSVTSIGDLTFVGCSSLTSVTIPGKVTSIEYAVFCDCSSLTSITIPSSVTLIREDAFRNCSSLTSITIPNSVTSIGWGMIRGCSKLKSISFGGTKANWKSISRSAGESSDNGNVTIKCSDGDLKFAFYNE